MKLWKRLAAMLLAGTMAVGATISAWAIEGSDYSLFEERHQSENGVGYGNEHFFVYGDGETTETLTNLGTIENYGDPERETSILIPASMLEKYPAGTMAIVSATITRENQDEMLIFYVRDGSRTDVFKTPGYYSGYSSSISETFMITNKMKENGILFTGYAVANEGELSSGSVVTVQSVEFTNAVAAEWEKNEVLSNMLKNPVPIAVEGVNRTGILLDENGSAKITAEALNNIPAGAKLRLFLDTTKVMAVDEEYHFNFSVNGKSMNYSIFQNPGNITDSSTLSEAEALFDSREYYLSPEFDLTEDMKENGITITGPSDAYIFKIDCWIPSESSEIVPVKPVVTPGFSSAGSSIQDVPVNTVVTQKTAVDDTTGRYGERFVKKVAASDVVGKTKATFTLSNGTATKTVSTTKYNTSLTVDGETISAGSGYVFLVYTLSGIPEDATVTVGDVILE